MAVFFCFSKNKKNAQKSKTLNPGKIATTSHGVKQHQL